MMLSPIEGQLARWGVVASAVLGAGCGEALFLSILTMPDWRHFVWSIGLMLVVSLGFIDPLADRLRVALGLSAHSPTVRSAAERLRRGAAVGLVSFVVLVLHHLIHYVAEENLAVLVAVLIGALLTVGAVTAAWLHGLERRPPRAAWLGAAVAVFMEGGLRLVLALLGASAPGVVGAMIRAGAIGFAGGWVLERWPGRHPARRCALAVVMTAALFLAIGWALAGMIALDPVFVYGGWALGLVLWPQADAVWGASRRGAADAEAEHAGRGR